MKRYLLSLGLQVIRYTNHEVLNNLDGVLEHLLSVLSLNSTSQLFPLRKSSRPLRQAQDRLTKEGNKERMSEPIPG